MTRRTHRTACRLVLGCLALPVLLAATLAAAAEKPAPAPDENAAVAPEPAVPAAAATPAPATPTAPPANGDNKVGTVGGRNLWETFSRGGPLMYPILACSVIGVAFAIERLISLRQSAVAPKHLAGKVLAAVGEEGTAAGIALCEQRPSAMARVLAAGLALVPGSREDITPAMQEAGERELWHLESFAK
ncbi:hypothetical protein HQ576_11405, partial [bacterium]|nr:hypothetical protein [bacterium]